MNEIKSKTDILGVYNKLKNLSEKIHEINCLHDAEITDIRYKNSILNLSLGYIPNRSNIYQTRERLTLLEVKNLIIIQSRNFGKNYSEDIEAWKKVKTRDINKLIAKGTLEFISIENRGNNYHIILFWSSNVNKRFYKRKYIKLSFS